MYSVFLIGDKVLSAREVFINLGTILGIIVLLAVIFTNVKKDIKKIIFIYGFCLIISIFGSRVSGTMAVWDGSEDFFQVMKNSEAVNFSGFVFIFFISFIFLYMLIFKGFGGFFQNIKPAAFYLAIQYMFNRIGCLMAGCCGGRSYQGPFAFHYSKGDLGVYPVQPFEIISMLVLIVLIFIFYKSSKINVFFLFLMWFGVTVIIGEIFMDNMYDLRIFFFTVPELTAVFLIILGIGASVKYRRCIANGGKEVN